MLDFLDTLTFRPCFYLTNFHFLCQDPLSFCPKEEGSAPALHTTPHLKAEDLTRKNSYVMVKLVD